MKTLRITHLMALLRLAVLGSSFWFTTTGIAGPITSNTALPVAEDELIVRGQGKYIRSTGDSTLLDRELTILVGSHGVRLRCYR